MTSQKGDTALKILFIMTVLSILAALASPWLLSGRDTKAERAAIGTLRMIHAAESDHYGASQMYGSLGKLTNSKMLGERFPDGGFKRDGYDFTHSTNGSGRVWCAAAVPEQGKTGRAFGIDESGVVYQDLKSASPCYLGTLDTSGGTAVR